MVRDIRLHSHLYLAYDNQQVTVHCVLLCGCKWRLTTGYMASFNDLYQLAQYYDIVFRRDVSAEVQFVCDVYTQLNSHQPQSLLDLACGPGYHARTAAQSGLTAIGLDLRPEMLDLAQSYAEEDGVQVEWMAADMRYLQLDSPVDIILNVFDGIDCLLTNDDLIAHFKAMSSCLTAGGIYLIDVSHPRYTSFSHYKKWTYANERDGINVHINWAINDPIVNPKTSVSTTELEILVNHDGETIRIVDSAQERIITAQEIDLLARFTDDLSPVGWYGEYDLNCPLENNPTAERMIIILQKQTPPA